MEELKPKIENNNNENEEKHLITYDEIVAKGESPADYYDDPNFDPDSVPEDKRDLYDTVMKAHWDDLNSNDPDPAMEAREKATREEISKRVSKLAKRATSIATRQRDTAPIIRGTYSTGALTDREHAEIIEARRNGTPM